MSGRSFFNFLLILSLVLFHAALVSGAEKRDREGTSRDEPVEITADRLTADNNTGTAVFEGSVVARQGGLTLHADWMKVIYSDQREIKEIQARGRVRLTQDGREITSDEAVYYRNEQMVVFTGNPVAREEKSTVTGSRMTYYIEEGRSVVENTRVIIKELKGPPHDS